MFVQPRWTRLHEEPDFRFARTVETVGPTGVEMEALTALNVALLTICDMCMAVDRWMTITRVRLLEKHGGKVREFCGFSESRRLVPRGRADHLFGAVRKVFVGTQ